MMDGLHTEKIMIENKINDFKKCLQFSLSIQQHFDNTVLLKMIPYAKEVIKTPTDLDKQGIDYCVRCQDDSIITVDAKSRQMGAKRFWHNGEPELCLERYSDVDAKIVGWLFKNSPIHPDYILYTFDKSDTDMVYLFPFHLLKKATITNGKQWADRYKIRKQPNGRYWSDAIFVPASVLIEAVSREMQMKVS